MKEVEGRREEEVSDFKTFLRRSWSGLGGALTSEPPIQRQLGLAGMGHIITPACSVMTGSSPREAQV